MAHPSCWMIHRQERKQPTRVYSLDTQALHQKMYPADSREGYVAPVFTHPDRKVARLWSRALRYDCLPEEGIQVGGCEST